MQKANDMQSALDRGMGLIGEVNRRAGDSVLQQRISRRDQGGQVCHRASADKQTTGCVRKPASSTQPSNNAELDRSRSRSAKPCSVENIESGGERVGHCAYEIVRTRNEREETRMIDVQIARKNVALKLRQYFIQSPARFRRILIEQRNELCRLAFFADRPVADVRKMVDQKIDYAISELPHLLGRERNSIPVRRGRFVSLFQALSNEVTAEN